ncbi:DUF2637 domain-containing protein [Streptomyces sp. SID13666]|uniref:DUF2637 domain-containing protein n=1 Tax=unclassified Streptomyces TaxID=2593676 RepID=UPI0013C1A8A3|nr:MULTISPECIES: DUF2637 domain-containing protein [unclassified Streptomyces]NEA59408.1 DUF2637 domain-containing protein [Streptomyces sp. SID13666]NEA72472.1 DUF2637 domain-containing protein [Streptomyces sp. SID13588]
MTATADRNTQRTVTAVMAVIAALAFTFSFGNVWTLALRLGVPHPVAPLIAPMVDLSVVGLLVALRHLALHGVAPAELAPAQRLMHVCGLLTLALNIAEPLAARHYGRAALDTVAPLLLLGWGKVGPLLLAHFHTTAPDASTTPAITTPARAADAAPAPALVSGAAVPATAPATGSRPVPAPLLEAGRRIAAEHQQRHGQHITAPELAARLGVASPLAGAVHAQLTA